MIIRKVPQKDSPQTVRAAAYCRVSTTNQAESYEVQRDTYMRIIESDPHLSFAGIYSDLGKTGRDAVRREGFMKMIRDACDHRFDRLYVKSISRFARSISDCQHYIDILTENRVTVIFERESLRTDDPSSRLALALLGAVAQDESRSIGDNVALAYRERYLRGVYNLGNNRILGYDTVDGRLQPNESSWIIRLIFKLYAGGSNYRQIRDFLDECGAKTLRGNSFSTESIRYILRNETYVGDKFLYKSHSGTAGAASDLSESDYPYIYLTDDHEPIIDRQTWEICQKRLHHTY